MTRRGRGVLAIALAALLSGAASAWPGSTGLAAPQSQEVAPAAAVAEQPAAQGATAPVLTLAEARTIIAGARPGDVGRRARRRRHAHLAGPHGRGLHPRRPRRPGQGHGRPRASPPHGRDGRLAAERARPLV